MTHVRGIVVAAALSAAIGVGLAHSDVSQAAQPTPATDQTSAPPAPGAVFAMQVPNMMSASNLYVQVTWQVPGNFADYTFEIGRATTPGGPYEFQRIGSPMMGAWIDAEPSLGVGQTMYYVVRCSYVDDPTLQAARISAEVSATLTELAIAVD